MMHKGMESMWYEPPGKDLGNIKISDRERSLHATADSWKQITGHLDRKRLIQEALDKEKAHKVAMKEGSDNMTKNWDNSVKNLHKKKRAERLRKLEEIHEERHQNYLELKAEQDELTRKFLEKAKRTIFIQEEGPRQLSTALVRSHILNERKKQQEMATKIKEHYDKEDEDYALKVKTDAEAERLEKIEERQKEIQKGIERGNMLKAEVERIKNANNVENELKSAEEKMDHLKAQEELEAIEKFERVEEFKRRKEYRRECLQFIEQKHQHLMKVAQEEKEMDRIVEIVGKAKDRIRYLTEKKKKQIQDENIARRHQAGAKLAEKLQSKAEEESKHWEEVAAEKERLKEEEHLEKERLQQQSREDQRKFNEMQIQQKLDRKQREKELEKWELLNRHKQKDVMKEHDEEMKKKEREKIANYRKEVLEQIAENKERSRIEQEEVVRPPDYSEKDRQFFEYAEETLALAKEKGLSTEPIEREIDIYKRQNNLIRGKARPCEDIRQKKITRQGRI